MSHESTDIPFALRVAMGVMRVDRAVAMVPGEKTSPVGIAAAHAVQQACANPGCLVRVYYRSVDECSELGDRMWGALSSILQLDEGRTVANFKEGRITIELVNGSGIELLPDPGKTV
jgi:hypothetical protein